jgi:hypothetical protein
VAALALVLVGTKDERYWQSYALTINMGVHTSVASRYAACSMDAGFLTVALVIRYSQLYIQEYKHMATPLPQIETELAQALRRVLPPELGEHGDALARAVAAILGGQASAGEPVATDAAAALLQALSGRSFTAARAVVSFGVGNQAGDVTIGDVAAGNIIKVYLQPGAQGLELSAPTYDSSAEARHRLTLLDIHRRRLRILEQQAAYFGPQSPPHILMEIDELGEKIARITGGAA